MTETTDQLQLTRGVLLCTVASARLAVDAQLIARIGAGDEAPWAGRCFGYEAPASLATKALMTDGAGLSVDSLEIAAGVVIVLDAPTTLGPHARRLVSGFVEAGGQLWPLVDIAAMGDAAREPLP